MMKLKKIKLNFSLSKALWVLIIIVVLIEALTLYLLGLRSLFTTNSKIEDSHIPISARVNKDAENLLKKWRENQRGFIVPEYSPVSSGKGRTNPFAEY